MSEPVKWQLLSQHLKAMSVVNSEFEDLILLASQLVQVLELESDSINSTNSLDQLEETYLINRNEELA